MSFAATLLLTVAALQDPVRVQSTLSRSEIHVGETTVLRVDVQTGGERAEIARLTRLPPGVDLASTRDYDQRQFAIPGGTRRFITREFVLRGRAEGRYRIPAIEATVDGRTYRTTSHTITVTAPPAGLRPPGSTGDPEGQVALDAWLDADTVYVGEQVTMNAEAMFSNTARLRLRRAPEYEAPSPSGFWVDDLPDRRAATTRMVDGRLYEVQGFRRAFFPLTPGRHVIPPARLEYEMRRGILYAPETFELLSDSMPLVVLPVPEAGRPAEFTGAVGRFTARGSVAPREVPAGEAVVLTVKVEGIGNIKAIPPPALPEIPGVEVFPPSERAEPTTEEGVIGGRKTFSWVLIPQRAGALEIPPIRYAYFDPDAARFEAAVVDGLSVTVTPGAAGRVGEAGASAATLRYLRTAPAGPDPLAWVASPWFGLAQLLPLIALAVAWSMGRPGGRATSRRELRRRRRATLRDLEHRAEADDAALLPDLEGFARGWLGERVGIRPSEAARAPALERAGVPAGVAASVAKAFERIAAARYAPVPPPAERRKGLVREVAAVLERVDREAPRPATAEGRTAGTSAGIILLLVLAGVGGGETAVGAAPLAGQDRDMSSSSVAPEQPAQPFAAGMAAFDAGRFLDAAASFEAHVRATPRDPAGWYNLGTAYHRAGHAGYAVWAWLHALRLAPRDGDTRHNLDVAGAAPTLVQRVAPALPLRPAELALLASLAWFVAGAAGALALAGRTAPTVGRRRRAIRGVAAVSMMLAVGLGAAWLAATNGRETLVVLEPATLRAGPALGGEPLGELAPGTGLEPVAGYGEWTRVRTLDGMEGWIENRSAGAL